MARAKLSKTLSDLYKKMEKENTIKQTPIEIQFISDLYESIKKTEEENRRPTSLHYHPSSMKCPRSMQYQLLGVEPDKTDISVELVGILESGTDRHLRIQKAINKMKENGFDCEYVNVGDFIRQRQQNDLLLDIDIVKEPTEDDMETKLFNRTYNISFMADGIIKYKGIYYILEIKTESTRKNTKRSTMAEEHIPQICAYKLSLGIEDVMMLYEDRDLCVKKAFHIKVTDEMVFDNVLSKIEEVDSCINTGSLATRLNDEKSCRYCGYRSKCNKDGD